jgi:hypothetical protein
MISYRSTPICDPQTDRGQACEPLTRPAPAEKSAGAGHPLPQGGEGQEYVSTNMETQCWRCSSDFASPPGDVKSPLHVRERLNDYCCPIAEDFCGGLSPNDF